MNKNIDTNNYLIIPDFRLTKVLMRKVDDNYYLPDYEFHKENFPGWASPPVWEMLSEIRKKYSESLRYLRYEYHSQKYNMEQRYVVYELENRSKDLFKSPENYQWMSQKQVEKAKFRDIRQKEIISHWFRKSRAKEITKARLPWFQKGWGNKEEKWIKNELNRLGITRLSEVEQFYISPISCILRINTNQGYIYYKTALECFRHEAALTAEIEKLFPGHLPQVISFDQSKGRMLMKEFQGTNLGEIKPENQDLKYWKEALKIYAGIQKKAVNQIPKFFNYGCIDRSLEKLPELLTEIIEKPDLLFIGDEKGLSREEFQEIKSLLPKISEMCVELADYNIPQTINHGDLHSFNIKISESGPLIYDWTDSNFSHPFFTLISFFNVFDNSIEKGSPNLFFPEKDSSELKEELLEHYLNQWIDYESPERLKEAFKLAEPLGKLTMMLGFHYLVKHMEEESKWLYQYVVPKYVQRFLLSIKH